MRSWRKHVGFPDKKSRLPKKDSRPFDKKQQEPEKGSVHGDSRRTSLSGADADRFLHG